MKHRFRITQPDGHGSSMHETVGYFDTKSEADDYLECSHNLSELMVEDRLKKESMTGDEFLNDYPNE